MLFVTMRIDRMLPYDEIRVSLDTRWREIIKRDIFPISYLTHSDFLKFHPKNIDGIILTGGNEVASFKLDDLSKKRNLFELELLEFALENSIPVYGVCHGFQLMAEYYGFDLVEIEGHVNTHHRVYLNKDFEHSKKSQLPKSLTVNSFHNIGVETADISDPKIEVLYYDDKGMVEAFNLKNKAVGGSMWHPERSLPQQCKLFANWLEGLNR